MRARENSGFWALELRDNGGRREIGNVKFDLSPLRLFMGKYAQISRAAWQ